jgi:hypothetical protein
MAEAVPGFFLANIIIITIPSTGSQKTRVLFLDLILTLDASSATGSSAFNKAQQFIIMLLQVNYNRHLPNDETPRLDVLNMHFAIKSSYI